MTEQTSLPTEPLKPEAAEGPEPRPHVRMLVELAVLGWYVTALRPDRDPPFLWRVTIARFDGFASLSVTDIDPDEALAEALRYASMDQGSAQACPHGPDKSSPSTKEEP